MTRRIASFPRAWLLCGLATAALLAGCERPPVATAQNGWRGTGMAQVDNPRTEAKLAQANSLPEAIPPIDGGPPAREAFKNVQVLGDVNSGQFTRTMMAITAWVSPKEGCAYCHKPGEDLASDSMYTKVVARKMLAMTRSINSDWKPHVAGTGVTCYTCHRGQPVPAQVWFKNPGPKRAGGATADHAGQNHPAPLANLSSLPYDPLTPLLLEGKAIRVNSTEALPNGNPRNIKDAEQTYALMNHVSQSLGVNCTFCHNSRGFGNWEESPVQRQTAFHGISMVRSLNNDHMLPLTDTFPAARHGPLGDVAKVNCGTCHQGLSKPLYGEPMAKDFPALWGGKPATSAAAPVVVPATSTTPTAVAPTGPLGKVVFASGKVELTPAAQSELAQVIKLLAAEPGTKVQLSGYADSTGNADQNMDLAKRRAQAVRDALLAGNVAQDRIAMKKPEFVIGSATADARRVEIIRAP